MSRCLERCVRVFCVVGFHLAVSFGLVTLATVGFAQQPVIQPASPNSTKAAELVQKNPTDVAILVMPTAADEARVGLAYRTQVPHRRVRSDVQNLALFGWHIVGPIDIQDESIHPDQPRRFPKTTGAEFYVSKANGIASVYPALQPVLQAFQHWNAIELIVAVNADTSRAPVVAADSPDLTVSQVNGQGVVRFEATIRKHSGLLSTPQPVPMPAPTVTTGAANSTPTTRPVSPVETPLVAIIVVLVGVTLLGFGIILLSRRNARIPTVRTIRR